MILVTLGTQDKQFVRLLQAIDKAIDNGDIKEEVIVQAGYTKYSSDNMKIIDYVSTDEFEELMSKCDLVISHGGAGSILSALKKNKPVIAAARLAKYGEHTNDHQKQILKEFSDAGYILELRDFNKLGKLIEKAKKFKAKKFKSNTENMMNLISDYIEKEDHISWYNKYKEALLYLFFGGCTTLVNIISYFVLRKIGVRVYISNGLAWFLSVLFAFITNKLFVFESRGKTKKENIREIVSFFGFRILSLGFDMGSMYLLFDLLKTGEVFAKIVSNILVIILNYIFSKIFVFKKKKNSI